MKLLENHIVSLILEKKMHASDKLKSIIKKITPTRISRMLLNQFDFNNEEDYLDLDIDYLDIGEPGYISFIPSDKVRSDNPWMSNSRQQLKISRILTKLNLTQREIENVTLQIKALTTPNDFRLVEGDEILHWYLINNCVNNSTMKESCMNQYKHQAYLSIYPVIGVKLLVLISNEKCIGRALVWTTDDGTVFMDRVYWSFDWVKYAFLEEAEKRGWLYKLYQSYSTGTEDYIPDMRVKFNIDLNTDFDMPFLDTFIYYYKTNDWAGFMTKQPKPKTEDDILLQCQNEDGSYVKDWALYTWDDKLAWYSYTVRLGNLRFITSDIVFTKEGIKTLKQYTLNKSLIYDKGKTIKISDFCKKYLPYYGIENGIITLESSLDLRMIDMKFIWDMQLNLNSELIYLDAEKQDLTNIRFKSWNSNIYIKNIELAPEKLKAISKECY